MPLLTKEKDGDVVIAGEWHPSAVVEADMEVLPAELDGAATAAGECEREAVAGDCRDSEPLHCQAQQLGPRLHHLASCESHPRHGPCHATDLG